MNDLKAYAILATDGPIGQVVDVLFDDQWAIQYLVVDTGTLLTGRQVLIAPSSIGQPDWAAQQLPVSMTKQRVEDELPDVATADPDLRRGKVLEGHQILATDGDLGHIDDLLVDDQAWAIRYFIVSTSNWWGGHKVLIAPRWASEVNWPESTVALDLSREQIKSAPPYDAEALFERQHEQAMHEHYGRPTYWAEEP